MEALVESCCASSDVARSSDSASITVFSDRPVQHEDQDDGNQNRTATCESHRLVSIASNLQTGTPKFRRDRDVGGSTMQARFPLWKIFNSTRPSEEISPEEATKGSLLRMIEDALGQQALEKKAE